MSMAWKFCPQCGTALESDWKFCAQCGAAIGLKPANGTISVSGLQGAFAGGPVNIQGGTNATITPSDLQELQASAKRAALQDQCRAAIQLQQAGWAQAAWVPRDGETY